MDPLQIFENFKLDTLDEKWSNEVWQREFMSFPEPPVDYSILLGSEDMEAYLKEAYSAVKKWMAHNITKDESNYQDRVEVSWQTFTALNINIRGLLAILGYLIKTGQVIGADEDSRQACLSSASLYLTLLSIPGSSTFHVFHPNLYQRAIETLKLSEHLIVHKKSQKTNDLESLYADEQVEGMLQSEKTTLVKGLNSILFDLITMLKTFYMKYQVRSLEITILCLVEVTKLETEVNHFQIYQGKIVQASKTSLSFNAYVALQDLCDPRHGAVEDTIRLIMRYLMPHLCPNYLDLPPKAANILWETIIHFLKNLLISKGPFAELGIKILIQHLLVKCPDRSEPRQKQAMVVSKLINICQGEIFLKSIENLIKFSYHNRIPYRIFAQEVIGKLLIEIPISIPNNNEIDIRKKAKIVLIATTLSRCIDSSSMVRGKAMSIIELIINSEKLSVRDFLNVSEEDKPFPTEKVLLKALSTDLNPLPGSKIFNSVLLDRIKDERALVRRSATHVLQNLVIDFPLLLNKVAPIIGHHCRDPALSVRRDAIHVLASLLQSHPFEEKILHEYVKAVLPRIYDVETKVQEKVLNSLQNLVLDKIKQFNAEKYDEIQHLPWKIIRRLTEEKMRKNLSKVCDIWVKNGIITNSLISNVQSHIGTDHDVEVWILLSSLAENVNLTNMKKYFEDYKEIIEGNDFVTTLKLEVLRYVWQNMGKDYLKNLYAYLYKGLCNFNVGLESISICIDILGEITKYLHVSGGEVMHSHVIDLIRLSETQIEQLTKEDEQIEEETINIYLKAMSVLGHASFLCSENVSESTLRIIQSLLLDCDSIQTFVHSVDKFKAAGIVLLGQQAMRDREIAEQIMPILGRLMCRTSTSESLVQAAIRINAVKALADLCVRFTALVEPYLPDMCISMKDPNVMVREAIVVIFVQLLLEDYIKVKGAFFYHILTMLSDNDETIRELTVFLIKERLLVKNKSLISQSFVRSLFHYNNCQTRHIFNDRKIREKERDALTLPGQKNQAKRWIIYDFMLEHLDPPSKLKILIKLNSEILEGVCEKSIDVKLPEGACVLKDVIYIILNDRMQASFGNKMQDEDCQDENTIMTENSTGNAINVIVEGMKKFKLNVMLQTLIKLRQFLSTCKSPLSVDVSKFLFKIISDFNKDQVAEIFDEYPELKKEIDQDISMYQKRPEAGDSDSIEKHVYVDKCATEESKSYPLKKRDLNANVSLKSHLKKQKFCATTSKKLQDIQLTTIPRIVLRRLSTLTYPGIKEWKSPPRETFSQISNPGPSSSGIKVYSKSSIQNINSSPPDLLESSSDLLELEPESTYIPKPNKRN